MSDGKDLAEAVLNPLARAGIMPAERVTAASDHARTALQASVVLDVNEPIRTEGVHARRTNERAVFDLAFADANFMVDTDVAFRVYFENIETKLWLDIHGHTNLIPAPVAGGELLSASPSRPVLFAGSPAPAQAIFSCSSTR